MDCSIFYQYFHSLGMGMNNERQMSYYLRIYLRCCWPCFSWNCCFNYGKMQNGISIKRYCLVKATIGGYKNWATKLRLVILVPNDRYKLMNRRWKCFPANQETHPAWIVNQNTGFTLDFTFKLQLFFTGEASYWEWLMTLLPTHTARGLTYHLSKRQP